MTSRRPSIRLLLRHAKARVSGRSFPTDGFAPSPNPVPSIDELSNDELARLNGLLPWKCFTVDSKGRRFGNRAWPGKREEPQPIPDPRIVLMNRELALAGKHVLEVGCFEGVHTIGLCKFAGQVTAVDSRIENVTKTVVRTAFYGATASVRICDVDRPDAIAELPSVDVVHHVGVLYHLLDPVRHLRALSAKVREGMMLDTHVAADESANASYESGGESFRYMAFRESGEADVFSGMYDHAKWLTLDSLLGLLGSLGYASLNVVERRDERNGLRVLLFAKRRKA